MGTSSKATPRRRGMSFRLLTLVVFISLLCAVLASVANELHRAWRRHQVAAELKSRGGRVHESPSDSSEWTGVVSGWLRILLGDERFPNYFEVSLGKSTRERDLALVLEFPEVKSLGLGGAAVTDAELKKLTSLDRIEKLHFANTSITDQGLSLLKEFPELHTLSLLHCSITDSGGEVLAELPQLSTLTLQQPSFTDAGLNRLQSAKSLVHLQLLGTAVTAQGILGIRDALPKLRMRIILRQTGVLQYLEIPSVMNMQTSEYFTLENAELLPCLKDARNLTRLQLKGNGFTDDSLRHLGSLSELVELVLWDTQVTGTGMMYLRGLQRLRRLHFLSSSQTDTGLQRIGELRSLESLVLVIAANSDAGLRHLQGLQQLRYLYLYEVSNDGLAELGALSTLKTLSVTGPRITDAGLVHLKGLTRLENLELYCPEVTSSGIADLQTALPTCVIQLRK